MEMKRLFLILLSRAKHRCFNFCEHYSDLRNFYSQFPECLTRISSILLKFVEIAKNCIVDFDLIF